MNRPPFVISLLGWLGLIGTLGSIIGYVLLALFLNLNEHIAPYVRLLGLNQMLAGAGFMAFIVLIQSCALLNGASWARILSTLHCVITLGFSVIAGWYLYDIRPQGAALWLPLLSVWIGLPIFMLGLLYSSACNQFFNPHRDPVPFNHYDTVRQIVMLVALVAIGLGSFRIWEFKTGRVPLPVFATADDPDAPKPIRTFTNAQGAKLQARLVYFDGAQVIIERADGARFTNPIGLYSAEDQAYIRRESGR
ncbi:MAG: hypothetical protein ABII82_01610 [Verrucomicrobiota bacterium]